MLSMLKRKLVIVGDSEVGKSAILQRLTNDKFEESYLSTIGVDFLIHRILVGEHELKLQLWDTAGQERFRSIVNHYYTGANAIVIVFDVTSQQSFKNAGYWYDEIGRYSDSGVEIFLVGNKADLRSSRQVPVAEAEEFARQRNMLYLELSARTGENVNESFQRISKMLMEKAENTRAPVEQAAESTSAEEDEQEAEASPDAEVPSGPMNEILRLKVVVMGDSGVGKSNVIFRLTDNAFVPDSVATIGVDFSVCSVRVGHHDEVKLQLWDIAGQERYRALSSAYFRGCDVCVFVFDLTSADSFVNLQKWQNELRDAVGDAKPKLFLVGNKADLHESRSVEADRVQLFAQLSGMTYFEVSAKDNTAIDTVRQSIAKCAVPTALPAAAEHVSREVNAAEAAPAESSHRVTKSTKQVDTVSHVKAVIVGDSSVGKSDILLRFADNEFNEQSTPTIGVDFRIRSVALEDREIKLQIWDTAGQERFRTITNAYYRGADVILLVFDATFVDSFNNVQNWLSEVRQSTGDGTPAFLIANKIDLNDSRRVDPELARKFAERHNMAYFEVSARDGTGVQELFEAVALAAYQRHETVQRAAEAENRGESSTTVRNDDSTSQRSQFGTSAASSERQQQLVQGSQASERPRTRSAKSSDSGSKKSASRSSMQWVDTRKLHDSLVKSETPETGVVLRQCEALLHVERTFVKDLTDMISEERQFAFRKREVLNAKWNDRVYEPVKQKLLERQRTDGYSAAIRRKLTSYDDYLEHTIRRDASFLSDFDQRDYDPFKWQHVQDGNGKPVRMTGVDPCQLYLHNQREETRLVQKYDRAAARFAKNYEKGQFEFYNQLPQLAVSNQTERKATQTPGRHSVNLTSAPSGSSLKRQALRRCDTGSSIAFGTHYFDSDKKKSDAQWANIEYFDVDSLSRHNTVDSIPLTRNKSHFELTWSSENDQMTVEREMNIPKRRGFPEVQKQKTAAEFREAHFKLEPVAGQRPIVNFDDKYIVGLKEQLLKENVPAEEICS